MKKVQLDVRMFGTITVEIDNEQAKILRERLEADGLPIPSDELPFDLPWQDMINLLECEIEEGEFVKAPRRKSPAGSAGRK